jgi:hypothetical protein
VNVEKAKKGYDTNLEGMTGKESGFVKKTAWNIVSHAEVYRIVTYECMDICSDMHKVRKD